MDESKQKEELVFPAKHVAEILGVTQRTLNRMAADGHCPRRSDKQYYLPDVVCWFIDDKSQTFEGEEVNYERMLLYRAQRHRCELENEATRETLYKKEVVKAAYNRLAAMMVETLEALPGRLSHVLSGEQIEVLQEEIREGRNRLADKTRAFAARRRSERDTPSAPKTKSSAMG